MSDDPQTTDDQVVLYRRRRRSWRGRLLWSIRAGAGRLLDLIFVAPQRQFDRLRHRLAAGLDFWLNGPLRPRMLLSWQGQRRLAQAARWQLNALFFGHRLKYLVRGTLLAIVVGVLLTGAGFAWQRYQRWSAGEHLARGARALAAGDAGQAIEHYTWLAARDPLDRELSYRLAESYALAGQTLRCRQIMQQLASPREVGYVPALVWLAREATLDDACDAATFAHFEARLQRAMLEQPTTAGPHEVLALAYFRRGRIDESEQLVRRQPDLAPQAAVELARWHAERGEATEARSLAAYAVPVLRQRALAQPTIEARLRWAEAVGVTGDHQTVAVILERGIELHGPEPFARELAELYVQYGDSLRQAAAPLALYTPSYDKALEVLDEHPVSGDEWLRYRAHAGLGAYGVAEQHLLRACASEPELNLELARFRLRRGDAAGSRLAARSALAVYQKRLAENPADEAARQAIAEAQALLGESSQSAARRRAVPAVSDATNLETTP